MLNWGYEVADDADRAAEDQEIEERAMLKRRRREDTLIITGYCHNCEAPCEGLFCGGDSGCRDDFEWRRKRGRELGKH